MTTSVPLAIIGVLTALGMSGIFVMPAELAGTNASEALAAQPTPLTRLYVSLLEQATVKSKAVSNADETDQVPRPPRSASSIALQPAGGKTPHPADAPLIETMSQSTVGPLAVNVRLAGASSSAVIAVLKAGQTVRTEGTIKGWTQVFLPNGKAGWVYARYLTPTSQTDPA